MLALLAVAAAAVLVTAGGSGSGAALTSAAELSPAGWAGLAGETRPRVSVGQRVLVVLRAASLADRVLAGGGIVSEAQERKWSNQARAKQKVLIQFDALIKKVLSNRSVKASDRIALTDKLKSDRQVFAEREELPENTDVFQVGSCSLTRFRLPLTTPATREPV